MEVILSEVNVVVLLLSKEVLWLTGECVLLSSATLGKRPPVLSREEVNKREWEVGSSSSGLFLVSFQALTGGPIVEGGVLPLRSTGILGTNLYGEILNGQSVGQVHTQDVRMIRLPDRQNDGPRIVSKRRSKKQCKRWCLGTKTTRNFSSRKKEDSFKF